MTELEISIGGRIFSVACDNEGQEKVREAAALINEEADAIQSKFTFLQLKQENWHLTSFSMKCRRLVVQTTRASQPIGWSWTQIPSR